MESLAVEGSGEHELVSLATELERYWSDQWRRAKEICDLLERRLGEATRRPQLRLVSSSQSTPDEGPVDRSPPPLKLMRDK